MKQLYIEASLLGSVTTDTLHEFLTSVGKNNGRVQNIKNYTELSQKQLLQCCNAMEQYVCKAVEEMSSFQEATADQQMQQDGMRHLGELLQGLQGGAHVAHGLLLASALQPPSSLLNTATLLHDNCLLAVGDLPEVQDPVARLCCSWWELQVAGKEQLMPQTLPYILIRAESTQRVADIKICCTMRDAFTLLDFEDPNIVDVKRLLLQAAFNPAFVSRPEGRRFLASLFNLDKNFVSELTVIVKNQIPSGRRTVLEAYGEIIFRAWREASGPCLLEVESSCIQEVMKAAIYASTPALAGALRQVLNGLHSEKRASGVDAMLLRLYSPILFRAFAACNSAVRLNALQLLLAAFPLMDPEAGPEDMEETLTLQFDHIRK
ncbi:hypothetical protein CEUSTIGMA_g3452.t1 [Chlamydomonas eustigma]|uniref:Uncharacterized protein n=1 Tax=Chlamydomonas eustigma TaxID=1157962 RepID=A0A250WZ87_9CHLO|nr:hypothetical protein CEUSTIGMA_g3452.t1 [Chlamydomonas eustigma]|eukprot:GAX76009.1 hypothetical protein CEUSTIGMA_g3452.t1 [Chlamydomonas eustigma]